MNVTCNTRILNASLTGVQRYLTEVMKGLPPITTVRPKAWVSGPMGHAWDQFVLPLRMKRGSVLWSPSNVGPMLVKKQVVTLHDLATFESPEGFSKSFRAAYGFILPRLLPRVAAVITVSEFTRQRAISRFKLDPAKVHAIPLGIDHGQFRPQEGKVVEAFKAKQGLPKRYILFLGALSARKNVARLIEAWRIAQKDVDSEVELVIAGGGGASHVFNGTELPTLPLRTRVIGRVSEAELPLLLAGAELFAFPSIYEGFGLPPLEAMACGTPCLVANVTSLPEVVGDAAILVNPLDLQSIADGLRMVGDTKALARYSQLGTKRAAQFTWQKTAARTMEVLDSCA